MTKVFMDVLNLSITASYLIAAVVIARFALKKAPKNICCFLWLLVGFRLAFPFSIESVFSLIPEKDVMEGVLYNAVEAPVTDTEMQQWPFAQNDPPAYNPGNAASAAGSTANTSVTPGKAARYVNTASKIWLAGVAAMALYLIVSCLRLKWRVRTSVPGIYEGIKYYGSDLISSPFLFGFITPKIYIPSKLAQAGPDSLGTAELSYILRHEQIHRRRRDYLIKPIGYLLLSVYWFNPFVWAAYILLCRDIELACDECVIRESGPECRKDYSQVILACSADKRTLTACPVAFGEIGAKQRIKNVLNYKKPTLWVIAGAAAVCLVIAVCFMTNQGSGNAKTEAVEAADTPVDALASVPVNESCIFTLSVPAKLKESLSFGTVSDFEVSIMAQNQEKELGKIHAVLNEDLKSGMYDRFYFIGDYGNNPVIKEFFKFMGTPEMKGLSGEETEIKENGGHLLIPNAEGDYNRVPLPNADDRYSNAERVYNGKAITNNGLAIANEYTNLSDFCYIYVPNNSSEMQGSETQDLQAQFIAAIDSLEIKELDYKNEEVYIEYRKAAGSDKASMEDTETNPVLENGSTAEIQPDLETALEQLETQIAALQKTQAQLEADQVALEETLDECANEYTRLGHELESVKGKDTAKEQEVTLKMDELKLRMEETTAQIKVKASQIQAVYEQLMGKQAEFDTMESEQEQLLNVQIGQITAYEANKENHQDGHSSSRHDYFTE